MAKFKKAPSTASETVDSEMASTKPADTAGFKKTSKSARNSAFKQRKGKGGRDRGSKTQSSTGFAHTNDPQWRLQNPALSSTVGALLFADPQGKEYTLMTEASNTSIDTYFSTQGALIFEAPPLWGEGNSSTSPLSIIGQKIQWLANVKWYSSVGYAPADVTMMIMAVDAIHIMLCEAVRAYALTAKYSTVNKFLGKQLVDALGYDYDAILANLAEFRYQINQAVTKINQLHLPNVFYVLDSHRNLYSRIFKESPSSTGKEQLYAFKSNCYWRYSDEYGTLQCYPWQFSDPGTDVYYKITPDKWASVIGDMIDDVLSSEFIAKMDADMLRVFPYSDVMHFESIGDVLDIEFAYDPYILSQIFNMEFTAAQLSVTINPTSSPSRAGTFNLNLPEDMHIVLPQLYLRYTSHYNERTDIMASDFQLSLVYGGSDTKRTVDERTSQLATIRVDSVLDMNRATHYFNVLDLLPKDPGVLLECAHFKHHWERWPGNSTADGMSNRSEPVRYTLKDAQDCIVTGVGILAPDKIYPVLPNVFYPGTDYNTDASKATGRHAALEYMKSTMSKYWQFSMPPLVNIASYTDTGINSTILSEIQDLYVADKRELARMNFVSIQSMWDPSRLPVSRNSGAASGR